MVGLRGLFEITRQLKKAGSQFNKYMNTNCCQYYAIHIKANI